MSNPPVQTQAGLDPQPPMPVRRLHNFIYCPRLFYFQWVENLFEDNADTVSGSLVHRNVDKPSRVKKSELDELDLPEGSALRSPCTSIGSHGGVSAADRRQRGHQPD